MRSFRLVLTALLTVAALGALIRPDLVARLIGSTETLNPCEEPLAWHLRSIDPRFGFTEAELRSAVEDAAAVWNDAAATRLFRRDTAGGMAIDLVYDERQRELETRRDRAARIDELQAEVDRLQSLLVRTRERAEAAREAFEADPSPETQRPLRDRVDRFNEVVARYNAAVSRYNAAVEEVREEGPTRAQAGNLRAETRTLAGRVVSVDRVLTVAVAGDYGELVVVLAHELGHALGIGHVSDPDALMSEQYRRESIALPVRLTPADRRALAAACEAAVDPARP